MDFTANSQSVTEKTVQLKILVVDDDILNQRMMQLLLAREGHLVDLASNGQEAIDAVQRQRYDIVFMDLQMPVMDGLDASRRIREWENGGRHTFIVALTASYLPEKGQDLFEAGIDNYVSKPFEIEHIQRLLRYGFKARSRGEPVEPQPALQERSAERVLDTERGIVQVGGDVDTYRELLGDFVSELPARLQTIQNLFASKDMRGLARAAHNLSGIAASLAASQLAECAKKLDKQSVEDYTESLGPLIEELQLIIRALVEISDGFLAETKITVESV